METVPCRSSRTVATKGGSVSLLEEIPHFRLSQKPTLPSKILFGDIYSMTALSSKSAAFASTVFATAVFLIILEFILAGSEYFNNLVRNSLIQISIISISAAAARLLIKKNNLFISALCGLIGALIGFFIFLSVAVSKI